MLFYENLTDFVRQEKLKLEALLLSNIPQQGRITKVLAQHENQNKVTNFIGYSVTHEVETLQVDFRGIQGDRHHGSSGPSTGRERALYSKGTTITQHRHLFAVSPYDCRVLSDKVGVEITPELLGANLVIEREDDADYSLSALPRGTYLVIAPEKTQELHRPPLATLIHYAEQRGCGVTGAAIAAHYKNPLLVGKFVEHSKTNRGIVCSIEYPVSSPAQLAKGQTVFFKFPKGIAP